MADDRPIEMPEEQIGRLETEMADLKALFNARFSRRPTGDIEPTVRVAPKTDTLILDGGTYNRATYPGLWAWAQEAGVVVAGLFTAGDGTTTFTVPNFAGRVPVGAGTLGADSYALGALVGASTVTLTAAQMPSHTHTGSTGTYSHDHGDTDATGGHGGHHVGGVTQAGYAPTNNATWYRATDFGGNPGNHAHNIPTDSHTHSVTVTATGGGTAHENRQPSIAINWLIWT